MVLSIFSASIINYFVLIAGLGISSYAVREGARVRNDQTKINQFASQMFTINVISTICSYACLIFFLVIWPQNHNLVFIVACSKFSDNCHNFGNGLGQQCL